MTPQLLQGDCLDLLKNIPAESVDLVVTDPPYRVISGGSSSKGSPSGMLRKNDGKIFTHNDIDAMDWMPAIYRVLKQGTHFYAMTNVINMKKYLEAGEAAGFKLHNILVWHKNNATPNRWYMNNGEYVLLFRKGPAKSINGKGSVRVHSFDNIIGKKLHPTEKPVDLMKYYIENSSDPGDLVLDPFMGSGSTGIACVQTGRRFIGMELDDGYFSVAQNRINSMEADPEQLSIFKEEITC